MNLPMPNHAAYTIQDWRTWPGRWELIHGVAHAMTPGPSPEHQRICHRLHNAIETALAGAAQGKPSCEVLGAPIDLYLPGEESVYQPDLVVVCDPARITTQGVVGPPDLVVEVLSPSTVSRDRARKRWSYEAAGVPEYLIVDPEARTGLLLGRVEGRYEESAHAVWGEELRLLGGRLRVRLM